MQETFKKPEELSEQEPKTPEKPPLRLVPTPEKEPEIYHDYYDAKKAGLFQPGAVFQVCKFKTYSYPMFVVIDFKPEQDKLTVRRINYSENRFFEENEILSPINLGPHHYGDFEKIDKIDIKKPDWDKQEYQPPLKQKTSGLETDPK